MGICCTRVISSSRLVITEIPFSILFITATGVVVVVGVVDSLSHNPNESRYLASRAV